MAKGKPPAFQFYPDSWLSSSAITLMTPAEEGAFIRLLCVAWMEPDCGLPDDDEALAVLSRLGSHWEGKSSNRIRRKFDAIGGRLFNPRLIEERQKQIEWARKSSLAGKKSGEVRNQTRTKDEPPFDPGSHLVGVDGEPNGNSSSSSSSSSSKSQKIRASDDALADGVDDALAAVDGSVVRPAVPPRSRGGKRTTEEITKALGQRFPWWEAFWSIFPCREGMKEGMDAFERRVVTRELATQVYRGAQRYAALFAAQPDMKLKYPQGWITGERWNDECAMPRPPTNGAPSTETLAEAIEAFGRTR